MNTKLKKIFSKEERKKAFYKEIPLKILKYSKHPKTQRPLQKLERPLSETSRHLGGEQ
jgi:hypothetical protein